jgi:DNA-binding MarR family transcriptional regulator
MVGSAVEQVLFLVRSQQWGTQSRMADAMGITGATLTHHLNALEKQGLVRRWREAENRRVQKVELTDQGEAPFARLRESPSATTNACAPTSPMPKPRNWLSCSTSYTQG